LGGFARKRRKPEVLHHFLPRSPTTAGWVSISVSSMPGLEAKDLKRRTLDFLRKARSKDVIQAFVVP